MSIVTPDIVQGNGARLTAKGWTFDRVFTVSGIEGYGDTMLVEAVQATNIPYGDPHPAMPGALATEFIPEAVSSDSVRVVIKYREFSQNYLIELGTRKLMKPVTTYFPENTGDPLPMKVYYKYPDDYELSDEVQGRTLPLGVKADIQTYYPTIVITRTEYTSIAADELSGYKIGQKLTGRMLTDRGLKYNGKLNYGNWDLRRDDPQASWRCEITAQSAEEGLAYRVRYFFAYDEDLWDFPATFKDPFTGEPVSDISTESDRPDPLPADWRNDNLMTALNFPMFKIENFSLLELNV